MRGERPVLGRGLAEDRGADSVEHARGAPRASNSPWWITTSAPRDHGPASVNHIARGESASAVHHTTSPRPASSQCSACMRAAKTAPCVCPISFLEPLVPGDVKTSARSRDEVSCVGATLRIADPFLRPSSSTYSTSGSNDICSIVVLQSGSATISDAPVDDVECARARLPRGRAARARRRHLPSRCRGRARASAWTSPP